MRRINRYRSRCSPETFCGCQRAGNRDCGLAARVSRTLAKIDAPVVRMADAPKEMTTPMPAISGSKFAREWQSKPAVSPSLFL